MYLYTYHWAFTHAHIMFDTAVLLQMFVKQNKTASNVYVYTHKCTFVVINVVWDDNTQVLFACIIHTPTHMQFCLSCVQAVRNELGIFILWIVVELSCGETAIHTHIRITDAYCAGNEPFLHTYKHTYTYTRTGRGSLPPRRLDQALSKETRPFWRDQALKNTFLAGRTAKAGYG